MPNTTDIQIIRIHLVHTAICNPAHSRAAYHLERNDLNKILIKYGFKDLGFNEDPDLLNVFPENIPNGLLNSRKQL